MALSRGFLFDGTFSGVIPLNTDHLQVVCVSLFVAILCLCIIVGHLLEEKRWINQSITATFVGCTVGTVILFWSKGSWWVFPKMGLVGLTLRDYLALGTIFSSTDTVCTLQTGLLTAYVIKALYFGRHLTDREIALMVLMAYFSYMLAELLQLSGILTIFFCGIVMSHYSWHNVTEHSRTTTRHAFSTMSFIAETFIFLYVGMDALDIGKWKMTKSSVGMGMGIYCAIILLIFLGRAAFVFPLSALSNYVSSSATGASITFKHQVIIWWAGLMRGAVSIALAFRQFTFSGVTWNPVYATMVTSTVIIVLFNTLVFGFATKPLIDILLPRQACESSQMPELDSPVGESSNNNSPKDDLNLPLFNLEESATTNVLHATTSLSLLLERPARTIHFYWRKFDDAYMRPVFGGPR